MYILLLNPIKGVFHCCVSSSKIHETILFTKNVKKTKQNRTYYDHDELHFEMNDLNSSTLYMLYITTNITFFLSVGPTGLTPGWTDWVQSLWVGKVNYRIKVLNTGDSCVASSSEYFYSKNNRWQLQSSMVVI